MIPLPTHSAAPAPALRLACATDAQHRYAVRYGQVVDNTRPDCPLTLIEAELRLAKLDVETLRAHPRVGRIIARDAVSLERAIKQCRQPAAEPARWAWPFNQHGGRNRA